MLGSATLDLVAVGLLALTLSNIAVLGYADGRSLPVGRTGHVTQLHRILLHHLCFAPIVPIATCKASAKRASAAAALLSKPSLSMRWHVKNIILACIRGY